MTNVCSDDRDYLMHPLCEDLDNDKYQLDDFYNDDDYEKESKDDDDGDFYNDD